MSKDTHCPRCSQKIYGRPGKNGKGWIYADTKDKYTTFHTKTCPSGSFKNEDINIKDKTNYKGRFSEIFPSKLQEITKIYNTEISKLTENKEIFVISESDPDFIAYHPQYNYNVSKENFYKSEIRPLIVGTIYGDKLIWVEDTKTDKIRIKPQTVMDMFKDLPKRIEDIYKYNQFYLFSNKLNTNLDLKTDFIYEKISNAINEEEAYDFYNNQLLDDLNFEIISYVFGNRSVLFNSKLTGIDELQEILKLKQEIGEEGEKFVLDYEKRKLKKAGLENYSSKVEYVSNTNISAGYDIKSFDSECNSIFIEVKSSNMLNNHFYISANEWETARFYGDNYYIYVVVLKPAPGVVRIFRNPIAEKSTFIKEVNSYKIRYK